MKRIAYYLQKISIRMRMRNATAELEAAKSRIANDTLFIDRLYRYRSELQSELFWLERNNMVVKRGAV